MKRILVIDDDGQVRLLVTSILERAGYSVSSASDGSLGIQLLRSETYDLIITDLYMPGKEGLETIMEIRSLNPAACILAISGGTPGGGMDYLGVAAKLGAQQVLAKPISRETLLNTVAEMLGETGSEPSSVTKE